MGKSYNLDIDADFKKNEKSLYPYLKRYNFQYANDVLFDFSKAIDDYDMDYIDEMIDVMPKEMRNVNIMEMPKRRGRRSEKKG